MTVQHLGLPGLPQGVYFQVVHLAIQPGEVLPDTGPHLAVRLEDRLLPMVLHPTGVVRRLLVAPGASYPADHPVAEVDTTPEVVARAAARAALTRALNALDGVAEAAVLTTDGDRTVAFLVPDAALPAAVLLTRAQAVVADPTPDAWQLVDHLPRTPDGALDRAALLALPLPTADTIAATTSERQDGLLYLARDLAPETAPRLHLDDLAPHAGDTAAWQAADSHTTSAPADAPATEDAAASTDAPLALAEAPALPMPTPDLLPDLLQRAAAQAPDQGMVFLDLEGGTRLLTYAELYDRARRLAGGLRAEGLQPGDSVILQCADRRDFLCALWGCFLAGLVPLPAAQAPDYSEAGQASGRIFHAWQMLGKPPVLTAARDVALVGGLRTVHDMADLRILALDPLMQLPLPDDLPVPAEDDLCLLLMTSGSTGKPKLVSHSHFSILRRGAATVHLLGMDADEVSLNWLPLDHVASIADFHLRDVRLCCRQVQVPTDYILADPLRWLQLVDSHRVSVTWAPNFAYALFADAAADLPAGRYDLSSMRHSINAGEAIVLGTACRFLETLAPQGLRGDAMLPAWGMSETASGVTYAPDFNLADAERGAAFMDLGVPIPGFGLRIVAEDGRILRENQVGRLQVRGIAVTPGYYLAPEQNAEVFTEDGWFQTGDLAMLRDGRLLLTGREKDVIIIRGLNYYCHEIESVAEAVSGVQTGFTAAVAVRDRRGTAERLAVFFHATERDPSRIAAVAAEVRAKVLRDVGLYPEYVLDLAREAIPKTGIGKIQRAQLKQQFQAGAYDDLLKQMDLAAANSRTVPHWFHRAVWRPHLPVSSGPVTGTVLLFTTEDHAAADAASWQHGDTQVVPVVPGPAFAPHGAGYQVRPGHGGDLADLFAACTNRGLSADHLAWLWPAHGVLAGADLLTAFAALVDAAAAASVRGIYVAGRGAHALPDDQPADPLQAALAALVTTAAGERPALVWRHVDLDAAADASFCLARAAGRLGGDVETAVRDDRTLVRRLTRVAHAGGQDPLRLGGRYLITGGLGGIGLLLARRLLRTYHARLVLVGRRSAETVAGTLTALAALPGEVTYVAVDVADADALQRAVGAEPFDGLFHLAGLAEPTPLRAAFQAEAALAVKVDGARAVAGLPLADHGFLAAASSVLATRYGLPDQGAYAAANRALENFCDAWSRETGKPAHVAAFTGWEGVGLNAASAGADAARAMGFYQLAPEAGLASFCACLGLPGLTLVGLDAEGPRLRALTADGAPRALTRWTAFCEHDDLPAAAVQVRDLLGRTLEVPVVVGPWPRTDDGQVDRAALARPEQHGDEAPITPTQRVVCRLFGEVLGHGAVAPGDNFFALGGHSVLALRLLNGLQDHFGVALSGPAFLAGPTPVQTAEAIERLLAETDAGAASAAYTTLTPDADARHQPFPLTDIQQAYHIGAMADLELGDVSMHLYVEVDMDAPDHARLEASLQELIAHHDMLRAVVLPEGMARILPEVPPYRIAVTDLRDQAWPDVAAGLAELRNTLSHQRFNGEHWPCFDIRLALTGAGQGRLFISLAALHLDGGSFFLLMTEWGTRYRDAAFRRPAFQLSYRDYALALRAMEDDAAYAEDEAYWKARLPHLPEAPALPYTCDLGSLRDYRFRHHGFHLPAPVWARLKAVAAKLGISRGAMGLAAYGVVLARWSRRPELTVNVTLFNRLPLHDEVNQIAGDFTSMVLSGLRLDPDDSFETLARRVQDDLWTDLAHRRMSGVKVLRELARQRRLGSRAAMPVIFTSALDLEMGGASSPHAALRDFGTIAYQMSQTPQVVLDLQLFEDDDRLLCMVDAVEAAFPPGLIADLVGAMEHLLTDLADEATWKDLPRLLPADQAAVRAAVNNTGAEVPRVCLHRLFLDRAARQGDKPAVIAVDRTLTYSDLAAAASRLAARLQARGARRNTLIGVVLPKGWGQAVAVLGIQMAGAAYLPIDPDLPEARRAYLLENGAATLAVTDAGLIDAAWPAGVTVLDVEECLRDADDAAPRVVDTPGDIAYVIFTSGSTGKPKGVVIEHAAAANTVIDVNQRFDVRPEDRIFGLSGLSFDLSVYDLFGSFAAGAALVLPEADRARDPLHWLDLLHRHGVSLWNSVPALMDILVTTAADDARGLPASLRAVLMSGDWIPVGLPDRIRALRPEAELVSMGGATEASIWSILHPIGAVDPEWKSIPYGKPMVNQRFYVLDSHLEDRPDFVPGDLYIGGVGLARGYWADADKTAASFIRRPRTGERLYRTGDLGRMLPDGTIEFLGREDFQVKVQGFRIELGEIEAALEEAEGVTRAVVTARGARDAGKQLLAFVTGPDADPEALRAHLAARLPAYMVPSAVVVLPELPLSATGKVDRAALAALGEAEADTPAEGYVAPRTPEERELAALWAELLGLPRVGMADDLMHLGVTSLLAIKAVALIRTRFGVDLSLRAVLSGRATPADLAADIHRLKQEAAPGDGDLPRVVADPDAAHLPFRFNDIQEAYWVGRMEAFELGGVAAYFYLEVALDDLDADRLQQAWDRVVARHPMLRAVFLPDGTQCVPAEPLVYPIAADDLSTLDAAAVDAALAAVRDRMAHQVLPTDQRPLFELRVSRLPAGAARLHFGLDLLIADAWSVQIIFQDLGRFYRDPACADDPLPLTFRDYLTAEAQLADSAAYQRAKQYWWDRLDTLPTAPRLPMVKAFADLGTPTFNRYQTTLPAEAWQALTSYAAGQGISPSGLLLAAFAEVLGYWSRGTGFTLNVTTFNRLPLHPRVDDIVGDFTTLNLLEVDGAGDCFQTRAKRLQTQLWQDLEHRAVGGLQVLRELGRRRGRKPGALVPIVFTSLLDSYGRSGDFVPLDGEVVFAASQTPQVWLDYQVREQQGVLYVTWDMVDALLPEGLPAALFGAYRRMLLDLAADPAHAARIGDPGLLPADQATLLAAVNATDVPLQPAMLHDLFAARAAQTPDAPAVLHADGSLTYGELDRRARLLAAELRAGGAQPNGLIAVALEKGPHQAVATLAVLFAGGAYLPMDPKLPEARIDYLLEVGAVTQVVTTRAHAEARTWPAGVSLRLVDALPEDAAAPALAPLQTVHDLAYVIFTSGSTGRPKGVMITHAAASNTILDVNSRFQVGPDDRLFALSALSFDLSVYDLFGAFAAGAAVVFPPADAGRDPQCWLDLLHRFNVSVWNSVPALMNMAVGFAEGRGLRLPDSLRLVLMSGDWIPVGLPDRIRAVAADPILISMGGATEAAIWSIIYPIGTVDPGWPSIPYGRPMANQQFHVLHPDLSPCPVWVPGDLYIGGVGLAEGYWGDAEKTEAAFITRPDSGERLYKTGDLGRRLPDGTIEFLGREDFQVKIQGFRIELGEIEAVLGELPHLRDVVVDAVGADRDNRRLAAFLVPAEAQTVDVDAVRAHLAARLPDYMVPSAYVLMDALPLTANGKVDRRALPDPAEETAAPKAVAAPSSATERELADLWAGVLGREQVDIHADFFELGGNSLMAIRMIGTVAERFGHDIGLRDFFENATVAGLAALLGRLRAAAGEEVAAAAPVDLPALEPRPAEAHVPFALNDIQQAYWMGRRRGIELGGVAAHFYFEIDMRCADPGRIQHAWRTLVARHDMLRVIFREDGRQQVLEQVPDLELTVHDLRTASAADREAALLELREELGHQVLPTDRWPLFDIHISRLEGDLIRAHFSFDLLLADAWSALLLFGEFSALYADPHTPLPAVGVTYRDYMAAMENFPETQMYAASRAYWQARVPSLPDAPRLPLQQDPAAMTGPRFERRAGSLPAELWQRLQARAAAAGLTPSGLLLAAYAEVLAQWSAHPRFSINVTTFNRLPLHDDIDRLVGDFTSLTLLATDGRDGTFTERARRVQQQLWEDLDHRHYSGIQVIRDLAAHKGRAPGALMPVVFTSRLFRAAGAAPLPVGDDGRRAEVVHSVSQTPQVWLDKQVFEEDGVLGWTWDSVAGLFPEGVADRMFACYHDLLESLADDDAAWQAPRAALVPADVAAAVAAVNQTRADLPVGLLQAPFFARAAAAPDATAVSDGRTTLTYAQLATRARRLAHRLRGTGAEELVAVLLPRGVDQAVAVLGILEAGAAYLPLDPQWPAERRAVILQAAGVRTVVTCADYADQEDTGHTLVCIEDAWDETAPTCAEGACPALPEQLAYVIYTSGSTGRPKGVAITHGAAANTVADINRRFAVTADDRVLAVSSLAFDLSVYDLFGVLAAGGTVVFPPEAPKPDPAVWTDLLHAHGITLWNSVPALMDLMVTHAEDTGRALPHALRLVLLSGDWLPLTIAARLRRDREDRAVISLGGATEGSIWSIHHPVAEPDPAWTSVPYGKALANQRMYVLDDDMRPRPPHVPGMIYIGGVGVARAYHRAPALTAAAYVPDPFTHGARLYKTGDLGRITADGTIVFLGRADFQVKVGGHRIELGDIESALTGLPEVSAAVVTAPWIGAARGPGGMRRLVAYLVPEAGTELPDADTLRAHLAARLPAYMVPAVFVPLERLPLTANGKIDRKALPDPAALMVEAVDDAPPATPMEARLAAVWKDILNLEQVGRNAHFFDLGGNSLSALRMLTRLRELIDRPVSLQLLFDHIVLHELAAALDTLSADGEAGAAAESWPQLVPDPDRRHEPFPLTQVQQAYWIGRMSDTAGGSVAAHAYYELERADFDLERFQEGFRAMIARHDALRLVIDRDGRQRILPDVPDYVVVREDLRRLAPAEAEAALQATRARMSHQVLDTETWPIFEVRASLRAPNITRLHLSFDLLIADAWSSQVLFHELGLYLQGKTEQLAPLACSFRDYVLAEAAMHDSARTRRARRYWMDRLPTLPPAPELPLAAGPTRTGEDATVFRRHADRLPADTWQTLRTRAAGSGITPSGVLLTAFCEVLAHWSASPRFCLNLTTFNRMPLHPQVNNLMGDFTSLTLLAVDAARGKDFAERARIIQEQLWADLDQRHMNGVEVLREMVRARGGGMDARAPIVFTSRLFGENSFMAAEEQGALFGEIVYSVSQTPQVWLDHQVVEEDGALAWTWDVIDGLFLDGVPEAMFAAYGLLLRRLAEDDAVWGLRAPAAQPLPACEAFELRPRLLHEAFFSRAAAHGDAPALLTATDTVTYGDLAAGAARVAHALIAHGAQPETLVAVLMEKGPQQPLAVLGIHSAGAAYLPLDVHLPAERVCGLLARGGGRIVLYQDHLSDAPAVAAAREAGYLCLNLDTTARDDAYAHTPPAATGTPDNLAYVIFTSGSTGTPKGVAVTHAAAANTVDDVNTRFDIGPDDRVLALSSLSFDLSVYDVFGPLSVGGALVLPDAGTERDPAHWARLMQRRRVTVFNAVPALMEMLVEAAANAVDAAERLPDCLRLVLMSGDWIPVTLPDRIRAQVPGVTVISMGGATEAAIWSILYPIGAVDPAWPSIPYGYAMAGQSFHVLNHHLQPCPVGVPGELYIGGVGLARAYWGDPEKTAASFITHPDTGMRLYRTGDHGRLLPGSDGQPGPIEFLGRRDNQVKILGHRVELGEIEAALSEHPDVAAAVVHAPYTEEGGGRHRRLIAYVVAQRAGEAAPAEPAAPAQTAVAVRAVLQLPEPAARQAAAPADIRLNRRLLAELLAGMAYHHPDGLPLPKYRYASAGSLYPVQVYLVVQADAVADLDAGIYVYHPGERRLLQVGTGDLVPEQAPPFALHLMARMSAAGPIYPKWAWDFCLLEAGYMRDLLCRTAEQAGYRLHPAGDDLCVLDRTRIGLEPGDAWCGALSLVPAEHVPAPHRPTEDWHDRHLTDHVQRLTFKLGQPGLPRPAQVHGVVPLPTDDAAERDVLYARRRSARAYIDAVIPFQAFSDWLACLGDTHLKIYLAVVDGKVEGVRGGAWRYDPAAHCLELLDPDAAVARTDHVFINRPIHDTAHFMLFMVAEDAAEMRDEDLVVAGELGQRLQDAGHDHQLAACALGVMEDYGNIRRMFGLGPHDKLLQNFIGGAVAPRITTLFEAYEEQQAVIRQMVAELPPEVRDGGPGMDMDDGDEVAAPVRRLSDDALKAWLAQRLPHYMVPGTWMYLAQLPLTANGKVDRKALPLPEAKPAAAAGGGVPRDALEQTISDLVADVLGLTHVGTTDNFFELGANSLQLVHLQGRLQEALQRPVAVTTLFGNPTVVTLAEALRGHGAEAALEEGKDRARLRREKGGAARKRKERRR